MIISPEIRVLMLGIHEQCDRWVSSIARADDEECAAVLSETRRLLSELMQILPPICPYCEGEMGEPGMDYDQDGYSQATHTCRCGAMVVETRYPPEGRA